MRILLGLTGSVATVLYEKIITELQTIAPVTVILTESSKHFVSSDFLRGCKVFTDENEWRWFDNKSGEFHNIWEKDDSVLHIKLRETYSAFVIAPCSMNTLAKITNGICDNLLTSVARAWDFNRPFIIAPAANTLMYEHPLTEAQFETFSSFGGYVVPAQSKMLACGTEGMGAMANIKDIVSALKEKLQWRFPLGNIFGYKKIDDICTGIPIKNHPGSFGVQRKHERHTGIDLYADALDTGIEVGIVEKSGNTYSYKGKTLGVGREKAKTALLSDSDAFEGIKKDILAVINKKDK